MGAPILEPKEIPVAVEESPVVNVPVEVKGKIYHMTCVSMGNPHAIIFMNNVKDLDIAAIGPYFENHTVFPKRTNTEFVEVLDRNTVNMRVWERRYEQYKRYIQQNNGSSDITKRTIFEGD